MKTPFAVIGYVPGKGYSFIRHSRELNESCLEKIWHKAMPRGKEWNTFIGARILKGFNISNTQTAISKIEVTEEKDEFGRSGLLKAVIQITYPHKYVRYLQDEFASLPKIARNEAVRKFPAVSQIIFKTTYNLQTIIVHPYNGADDWQTVEALVLQLILSLPKPLVPRISFTTLALSQKGESLIVALPLSKAKDIRYRSIYVD